MNKNLSIKLSILFVLFVALGVEALAQCGCGRRGRHHHQQPNAAVYDMRYHPQYAVSARSTANTRYNMQNIPVRFVQPNYGYGYNPYGYNPYAYGYGYNGYNGYQYNQPHYNRGNCGQGYYQRW